MKLNSNQMQRVQQQYRKAYAHVQDLLTSTRVPGATQGVFALDTLDIRKIAETSPSLARAERLRRQWRAALHAMAELEAMGTPELPEPDFINTLDPENPVIPSPPTGLGSLDHFISVVHYARSAGCMYVDGGFEPSIKGMER